MPSKLLTSLIRSLGTVLLSTMLVLLAFSKNAFSAEKNPGTQFLGMNSCSSSSCHGGAAEKKNECVIWLKQDFHSRAFATLTTARSARLGEVLKMGSPKTDARCTSCHAPFQTVPSTQQRKRLDATAGVSCETCHGPAESWLRSHTRSDFTHVDRVNAGMRDLKNLYVRANSCVACHQNVSSNLLAAGHPELIFELDGQSVSEPKHWSESTNWSGAQTWLVGQAVALREMSWELSKTPNDEKLRQKWSGLFWLLAKIQDGQISAALGANEVQKWSDDLARKAAEREWSPELTRKILHSLANTRDDFQTKDLPQPIQARRAERLVLAMDRLVLASDNKLKPAVESELNELFSLVQSLPDFDPAKFAQALGSFSNKLRDFR